MKNDILKKMRTEKKVNSIILDYVYDNKAKMMKGEEMQDEILMNVYSQ